MEEEWIGILTECLPYLPGILGLFALAFVSRTEPLLEDNVLLLRRPFRRSAVYLYRLWKRTVRRQHWGSTDKMLSAAAADNLRLLDPSLKAGARQVLYTVLKIERVLMILSAGLALALCACAAQHMSGVLIDGAVIERPGYEESAKSVTLHEEQFGDFLLQVEPRQYDAERVRAMAQDLTAELPSLMTGENADLHQVHTDLHLPAAVSGYPFRISWQSSAYSVVDTDGTVYAQELDENGCDVTLTAVLQYGEYLQKKDFSVHVQPLPLDPHGKMREMIHEELSRRQQEREGERMYLPVAVDGIALRWSETAENTALSILLGAVLLAFSSFFLSDSRLQEKVRRREDQLRIDYPQLVSKSALLLGAGMSVRNIFLYLGADYLKKREQGAQMRYVYEEILLVCRALESGVSEQQAYENFGLRCRCREYIRFCSLLNQNLQKGNRQLLQALQEEAQKAFEERRSTARKKGEEAGTKLLMPMILMLAVTLVIIIIPAYKAFSI